MGPLPSFSRCFRQLLSLSELHPFIPEYDGCAGSPVGRKAGAPFLSGWAVDPHRLHHIFPGEVLQTLWVGLHIHACGGWLSCPIVSSDLSPILTWNTLSTIHPAHTCTVPH